MGHREISVLEVHPTLRKRGEGWGTRSVVNPRLKGETRGTREWTYRNTMEVHPALKAGAEPALAPGFGCDKCTGLVARGEVLPPARDERGGGGDGVEAVCARAGVAAVM